MMNRKKIQIYDTTLRDGSQGEDISFSVQDKLLITRRLDEAGFDYIEGGWPGANPKDAEFFEEAKKGDAVGLKADQEVKDGAEVYKVT